MPPDDTHSTREGLTPLCLYPDSRVGRFEVRGLTPRFGGSMMRGHLLERDARGRDPVGIGHLVGRIKRVTRVAGSRNG
jgi:hypothetical protein